MKHNSAITAVSLALMSVTLVACEASDKDLALYFAKEWGKLHGLYDENGNPTKTAIARGIAPAWLKPDIKDPDGNVDPAGNAAVDAGVVVKDIVDNDKIALGAMDALKAGDSAKALKEINVAVRARPNDWYYLNRRGVINATAGNSAQATKDFEAAEALCNGSARCIQAVQDDRGRLVGF